MTASDTEPQVTLVIPARNAAGTLGACLDAAVPLLESGELAEIIVVNDGSTDETADIAAQYPVRCITGPCRGPGAARNAGWREAHTTLVWFIDADCIPDPDALEKLLSEFDDESVVGVGGSLRNMRPNALLDALVHEEIRERHNLMRGEVNYLATGHVIYRRSALASVDGFAEQYVAAEDADLAFRLHESGGHLRFNPDSLVGIFHDSRPVSYLKAQYRKAYFRVALYLAHPQFAKGDSYSGLIDHVQPPLSILLLATTPLIFWPVWRWVPLVLTSLLLIAQLPMTLRLMLSRAQLRYAMFIPFGFVRAFARGLGMVAGGVAWLLTFRLPRRRKVVSP